MKMRKFFLFFWIFTLILSSIFISSASADHKHSYIYEENSINNISTSQINAIEFLVPIVQVNSPPNQLVNIFDENNRSISYVNHNKTMLFYLASGINDVQFMVTLENGRVLSLHFKGNNAEGNIVRIPETMSGRADIRVYPNLYKPFKKYPSFDVKIKNLMRAVFFDSSMDSQWVNSMKFKGGSYKNMSIKQYKEWKSVFYKISQWEFCSNSKSALLIDFEKFIHGHKVLAATLSRQKLQLHECAKLIILYDKGDGDAV